MTIPLTVSPGQIAELANPNQANYWFWNGNPTSAQYYINNKGVPESEACTWGNGAKASGNWAPLNFGTSWDDFRMNMGFSGLAPNNQWTQEKLDFSVTFTGDGIQNACKWDSQKQQYCQGSGNDFSNCGNPFGCTVNISSSLQMELLTHHRLRSIMAVP